MRVLVTGAGGQLGHELFRTQPQDHAAVFCDSSELDITDAAIVAERIGQVSPDVIINAAAYTAVGAAEGSPDHARAVNAAGAGNLAKAAHRCGARLIQVSTDYVFSGQRGTPYTSECEPDPVNVYGRTKREGEEIVLEVMAGSCTVLRTSWVYSRFGSNFVRTMLRLMERGEGPGVVCDQVGTPTWARDLAEAIWQMSASDRLSGIHHWTNAGVASWYDFAVAIQEEAAVLGLLAPTAAPVRPLTTAQYPTPERRPPYSVLDKSRTWDLLGGPARHWRAALRAMLTELADG